MSGSIGNMTGTLIETGARHMQQCRTNYDVLKAFAGSDDELLNNGSKWSLDKDELVVSCGRHLVSNAPKTASKYAYPSVITCVGDLEESEIKALGGYYHFMGRHSSTAVLAMVKEETPHVKDTMKVTQFRQFLPVGYSVGHAEAHGYQGDTVASVQIGGLRTVPNGEFEVQTGDLMQMYIPTAETPFFKSDGGRLDIPFDHGKLNSQLNLNGKRSDSPDLSYKKQKMSSKEAQRRDFYSRQNGVSGPGGSSTRVKTGLFSVKPYMETLNENGRVYYGDKIRIFARALSSARPFEPVDIMIARQSL